MSEKTVWLVEASLDQYEAPSYVGVYSTEEKADEAIRKAPKLQDRGWYGDYEFTKVEITLDEEWTE